MPVSLTCYSPCFQSFLCLLNFQDLRKSDPDNTVNIPSHTRTCNKCWEIISRAHRRCYTSKLWNRHFFKYLLTDYSYQVFCQEVTTSELRSCLSENKSAREQFQLKCLNTGHRVHVSWFVWCKWKESTCHPSIGHWSSFLGSVNSGSPHRSNVTFKAEKIFFVHVCASRI